MAKLSMKLKQQAEPKFSTRRYNRCKICGRPHAICVTTVSAVSASVSWLTRARSPASGRLPGNQSMVWPDRMPQPSGRLSHKAFSLRGESIPSQRQ